LSLFALLLKSAPFVPDTFSVLFSSFSRHLFSSFLAAPFVAFLAPRSWPEEGSSAKTGLAKARGDLYKSRQEVRVDESGLQVSRKTVLVVLFVPSVERDGITAINQDYWVGEALETLGQLYGGATAFPRARGVWRDDERGGALVKDEPVVIHCYTTPADIADPDRLIHEPDETVPRRA
jgi:hypothetical protein